MTRAGAPQDIIGRRNGELAHEAVAATWTTGDWAGTLVVSISRSGRIEWGGTIFNASSGDVLRRLRLNQMLQVTESAGVAASSIGCPSWLPCPSPCDLCGWTCSNTVGELAGLGFVGCLSTCSKAGNPYAAIGCGVICSALVISGDIAIETKGCPLFCEETGWC